MKMLFLSASLLLCAGICTAQTNTPPSTNSAPRPLDKEGLPNAFMITPDLYRGAQPTADGMKQLEKLGIRTVVNLRSFHSDRDELKGTNLKHEHIYMKTWHPEDEEVVRFLRIVSNTNALPVFVHCQHGSDRTGTMCAIYRVAKCGWSKDAAITEMVDGGFGFHRVWTNLVEYVRGLDIETLNKQATAAGNSPAAKGDAKP